MSSDRSPPSAQRRPGPGAGFTLVETLVALTVLAAVSPALLRMVVTLRAGTEAIDDRTRSEIVARSLLDAALGRRDAAHYSLSGSADGRRWSVDARPFDRTAQRPRFERKSGRDADAGAGRADRKAGEDVSWMPVSVTIRVETAARPLRIETIALARRDAS